MPVPTTSRPAGPCRDYWTFAPILRSFGAVGYGRIIETPDGMTWRVRGGDVVLLTPPAGPSAPDLPAGANPARARSLVWCRSLPDGVPRKAAGYSFDAPPDWAPPADHATGRVMRRGRKEGLTAGPVTADELRGLLDRWVHDKKENKPTAMVVRGHYGAMIDDPGMRFVGYRPAAGGELLGAFGHADEGGEAVVGFAKHGYGTWWLARFLWATTVAALLAGGARGVVCGDTADRLKRELGFRPARQWRVDFGAGAGGK